MAKFVVDTHALIWFLARNPRLGVNARQALSDPTSELVLPAIALAECLWILGSRDLGVTPEDLLSAIDADPRITVDSLSHETVVLAQSLETIGEMHDRQIVATALQLSIEAERFALVTRDENIAASGLVPIIW